MSEAAKTLICAVAAVVVLVVAIVSRPKFQVAEDDRAGKPLNETEFRLELDIFQARDLFARLITPIPQPTRTPKPTATETPKPCGNDWKVTTLFGTTAIIERPGGQKKLYASAGEVYDGVEIIKVDVENQEVHLQCEDVVNVLKVGK